MEASYPEACQHRCPAQSSDLWQRNQLQLYVSLDHDDDDNDDDNNNSNNDDDDDDNNNNIVVNVTISCLRKF